MESLVFKDQMRKGLNRQKETTNSKTKKQQQMKEPGTLRYHNSL